MKTGQNFSANVYLDHILSVDVEDHNGAAFDLTGISLVWTLFSSTPLVKTSAAGEITISGSNARITLDASDLAALDSGSYSHQVIANGTETLFTGSAVLDDAEMIWIVSRNGTMPSEMAEEWREGQVHQLYGSTTDSFETAWRLTQLLTQFAGAGESVSFKRVDYGGPYQRYIWREKLAGNKIWRFDMESSAAPPVIGGQSHRISTNWFELLCYKRNIATTPATVHTGAWFTSESLSFTGTAADFVTLTTDDGITTIGLYAPYVDGGIVIVEIDGSRTLADLLPTAQDLVNAGSVSSNILVANGGPCNPTDRVYDTHAAYVVATGYSWTDQRTTFTTSLSSGSHTIKLIATAFKNTASPSTTFYMASIMVSGNGLTQSNAQADYIPYVLGLSTISVWEISYNTQPTGGTYKEWIGHTGTTVYKTMPVLTVDGVAQPITNGVTYVGSEIILDFTCDCNHPEVANCAVLTISYTLNKTSGLTIDHDLAWSTTGVAGGYPCMMPVNKIFDRGTYFDAVSNYDLDHNDDSVQANSDKQAIYGWDENGYIGALMYIPDLVKTVENWTKAGANKLWWRDMPGTYNKAYATRFLADEAFTAATIWESTCNYRWNWFPNGAEAALAK